MKIFFHYFEIMYCDLCHIEHHESKILPCDNCNLKICSECFLVCNKCRERFCLYCIDDNEDFIKTYFTIVQSKWKIEKVVHYCYKCR